MPEKKGKKQTGKGRTTVAADQAPSKSGALEEQNPAQSEASELEGPSQESDDTTLATDPAAAATGTVLEQMTQCIDRQLRTKAPDGRDWSGAGDRTGKATIFMPNGDFTGGGKSFCEELYQRFMGNAEAHEIAGSDKIAGDPKAADQKKMAVWKKKGAAIHQLYKARGEALEEERKNNAGKARSGPASASTDTGTSGAGASEESDEVKTGSGGTAKSAGAGKKSKPSAEVKAETASKSVEPTEPQQGEGSGGSRVAALAKQLTTHKRRNLWGGVKNMGTSIARGVSSFTFVIMAPFNQLFKGRAGGWRVDNKGRKYFEPPRKAAPPPPKDKDIKTVLRDLLKKKPWRKTV